MLGSAPARTRLFGSAVHRAARRRRETAPCSWLRLRRADFAIGSQGASRYVRPALRSRCLRDSSTGVAGLSGERCQLTIGDCSATATLATSPRRRGLSRAGSRISRAIANTAPTNGRDRWRVSRRAAWAQYFDVAVDTATSGATDHLRLRRRRSAHRSATIHRAATSGRHDTALDSQSGRELCRTRPVTISSHTSSVSATEMAAGSTCADAEHGHDHELRQPSTSVHRISIGQPDAPALHSLDHRR